MLSEAIKTARLAGWVPTLSVIIPCFNEEQNLPIIYERVRAVLDAQELSWELIAVDDHSADRTFEVGSQLARADARVRVVRLARNIGSHMAIMCGLDHALGTAAVMIAADMQDPPEIILELLKRWRDGDQVVWAIRAARKGVGAVDSAFSRVFHALSARIIGHEELAAHGADLFLVDRVAIDTLVQHREANLSLFSLLGWLGFRQGAVSYVKEERQHGRSGWTLQKKLKLFVDSITAFSYFPIRLMSLVGVGTACFGSLRVVCDRARPDVRFAGRRLDFADDRRAGHGRSADDNAGNPWRVSVARAGRGAAPAALQHRALGRGPTSLGRAASERMGQAPARLE
jgi:polyisoprenyl-phosphate glycosyltransferase